MIDVATAAHTKIGNRKAVIPFARILKTVTIRLRPPRIEDQPATNTPIKNICIPTGALADSGGYPVQPVSNPPKAKLLSSRTAAGGAIQNEKAFRRGVMNYLAPIMIGTR